MSSEAQSITNPALESFAAQIAAVREKHWPRPDGAEGVEEIFHYCDAKALQGIVTSKHLWASDIFSLNDSSEVEYARQMICEALSAYPQFSPIHKNFSNEGLFMDTYKGWNTSVCCFSAGQDLLSQWRAYGSQGNGFAIGFSTELLQKEGDGPPMKFSILPIVYSRSQQVGSLRSFFNEIVKIDGLLSLLSSHPVAVGLEIAMALLVMMAPIKNPVFQEEREWRILVIEDEPDSDYELLFRPIRGAIVPYVEIPLKPTCFTKIVQGPTSHKEFGERSLRMFLRKNGLDHVKVESSAIPLRSL